MVKKPIKSIGTNIAFIYIMTMLSKKKIAMSLSILCLMGREAASATTEIVSINGTSHYHHHVPENGDCGTASFFYLESDLYPLILKYDKKNKIPYEKAIKKEKKKISERIKSFLKSDDPEDNEIKTTIKQLLQPDLKEMIWKKFQAINANDLCTDPSVTLSPYWEGIRGKIDQWRQGLDELNLKEGWYHKFLDEYENKNYWLVVQQPSKINRPSGSLLLTAYMEDKKVRIWKLNEQQKVSEIIEYNPEDGSATPMTTDQAKQNETNVINIMYNGTNHYEPILTQEQQTEWERKHRPNTLKSKFLQLWK